MTYEAGAPVWTRAQRQNGHTRLPAYLRGKPGVIVAEIGVFPLPDENVGEHKSGRRSRLYTVAFQARDVFDDAADDQVICADLFEEYLRSSP